MAGEDGVSYDSEKQGQVAPKVQESQEAVQASSKASYSLSSAQTNDVWGSERGPSTFGHRSSDMFSAISDILSKENDLIGRFEIEMRNAMESHTRTDSENADAVHSIRGSMDESAQKGAVAQALSRVNNSQEANALNAALSAARGILGGFLGGSVAAGAATGAAAGAAAGVATGGETEGTRNAPVATSAPDDF